MSNYVHPIADVVRIKNKRVRMLVYWAFLATAVVSWSLTVLFQFFGPKSHPWHVVHRDGVPFGYVDWAVNRTWLTLQLDIAIIVSATCSAIALYIVYGG